MTVRKLLEELEARGITIEPRLIEVLHLAPKSRLTPELLEAARYYKPVLLARLFTAESVAPNSRSLLVSGEVKSLIEAIEAEVEPMAGRRSSCGTPAFGTARVDSPQCWTPRTRAPR